MIFSDTIPHAVNMCMNKQDSDKQCVDNKESVSIEYIHTETDKHGDIRINNAGRLEYYTEGYWQESPWLDRDK